MPIFHSLFQTTSDFAIQPPGRATNPQLINRINPSSQQDVVVVVMSNMGHLIRRQSSRELLRAPLADRSLELRLLPAAASNQAAATSAAAASAISTTYGTSNAAFVVEEITAAAAATTSTVASIQQVFHLYRFISF